MRALRQEKKKDWIVRRLHSIPMADIDEEVLRARALAALGACAGLLASLWLFFDFLGGPQSLADQVLVCASIAMSATFLFFRFHRTVYWPGMWFGTWLVIALASQLILEGEAVAVILPMLILVPAIFGLVVSAHASAISTTVVCMIFLATACLHLLGEVPPASDFQLQLLISAFCTVMCGGLVAYFSLYREQENKKLVNLRRDLEKTASIDPLTGVGNRRAFDQKIRELKLASDRTVRPALILFDVDKFKLINDTFGHAAGDHVLIELSQRISDILEDGQTLFRLGGDEFAIVFDNEYRRLELERAAAFAIKAVRKDMSVGAISIKIDISIGISMADGDAGSVARLYGNADVASFLAKEHLGSKAIVFDEYLNSKGVRRAAVETRLNAALAHRKIDLAFQPQVNIHTNEVVGFESLARWTDAELGVVGPDEFVRIAEESLLIDKLDRFIVAESLRKASDWLGATRRISINASGRSIVSADFCRFVIEQVALSRLDPDQVEIEITETFLIANWETCRANLDLLRSAGLRIVLDDFGIGYSSLSYLAQFPVQKLKFDRSFLLQMRSSSSVAVLQTIIRLAEALNMEVIAEGVDQSLHVNLLQKLRCKTAQGFLYSKPILSHEMKGFVRNLDAGNTAEQIPKLA